MIPPSTHVKNLKPLKKKTFYFLLFTFYFLLFTFYFLLFTFFLPKTKQKITQKPKNNKKLKQPNNLTKQTKLTIHS
jgi:hypothetical protein